MAPPLLSLQDVHLTFGVTPLLTGADLFVSPEDKICLVGRNGSGKSTLLKIAAGLMPMDSGERFVQPGVTIRYLAQESDFSGYESVESYVESGLNPDDDPHIVGWILEEVGVDPKQNPLTLSGGEAKRVSLAQAMVAKPDILLLDEPTNHLDLPMIEWVENSLINMQTALVVISHDRRLLENVSKKTVWIDRGETRNLDRGFAYFENWRDEVFENEERERERLKQRIEMEEHWLRYGVTARRKRNVRRLENLHTMRESLKKAKRREGGVRMNAVEAEQSAKLVIDAKNISKRFGERDIVSDFSIRVRRGDRIGIVGPNGSGKTTLLSMLTGGLTPDNGHIRLGKNLEIATLDQKRSNLKNSMTLAEALTQGDGHYVVFGDLRRHVVGYMKDFLFKPEQRNTPISVLSGGERGRIMLARALSMPSNFMILDEPTNDLDLETLDLLEEMLSEYGGTILLVSHDRDFLDRVVTSIITLDEKGLWRQYAGGYSDMLLQKKGVDVPSKETKKSEKKSKSKASAANENSYKTTSEIAKLSFKQKHQLENLPDQIEALKRDIDKLQSALNDPELYQKDQSKFDKYSSMLVKAQNKLQASEEEWLELEILREELEE